MWLYICRVLACSIKNGSLKILSFKTIKQLWIEHLTLWMEGYLELRLQFFRGLDYFNWRTEDPTDVATCQPPSGHPRFRPRWSPPSSCCPLDDRRRTGCPASPGRSRHAYPGHSSIHGYLVAVYPAEPYCQGGVKGATITKEMVRKEKGATQGG